MQFWAHSSQSFRMSLNGASSGERWSPGYWTTAADQQYRVFFYLYIVTVRKSKTEVKKKKFSLESKKHLNYYYFFFMGGGGVLAALSVSVVDELLPQMCKFAPITAAPFLFSSSLLPTPSQDGSQKNRSRCGGVFRLNWIRPPIRCHCSTT